MDDKELIQWHLHQAAVNHKLAETAASTASYAQSCECEKMHRDTAARLRELVDDNEVLRAECKAWRRSLVIELSRFPKIRDARAATDARNAMEKP